MSLVLRVSTYYYQHPPTIHGVAVKRKTKNGRWTKRPERTPGKQCKRRTMHQVTIHQSNEKRKTKRSKPQPRKPSPERILKVLKSKRSAPEGKQQIPPPKPILLIRWVHEADDANHREEAPVDWEPKGRVVGKCGKEYVCRICASMAEVVGRNHGKDGHFPRPIA